MSAQPDPAVTDTASEHAAPPGDGHVPEATSQASPPEPSPAARDTVTGPDTGPAPGRETGSDPGQHRTTEPLLGCDEGAGRLMIPVDRLCAHPGNIRRDLALGPEFTASIQDNGVLVPLRITPDGDGYRVIEGHRRLAAAARTGQDTVPCDLVPERAGDEAGQYLDMYNLNRHRRPLAPVEEADALFAAREAGATKTRIRKSTGLKAQQVTAALAAAGLSAQTRAKVEDLTDEMTLDDLAILADFQDDPKALARLLDAASYSDTLEHHAQRLRLEREEQAAHQRVRADLEASGIAIRETLPPGGQALANLRQDGQELTPEQHAQCPGRGVFFRSYDPLSPVHYCTDPAANGHALAWATPAAGTPGIPGQPGAGDLLPGPPEDAAQRTARRLVIEGNRAWKAAAEVRHRWLATQLFARRTAVREVSQFVASQLLTMPAPVRNGLTPAASRAEFGQITGLSPEQARQACQTAPATRLPLLMLAPIVTAYELAMTEGEGKNTWRPDRYSPCPHADAGVYLAFLASVGYQFAVIEHAVADGTAYTGDSPPASLLHGTGTPAPASGSAPVTAEAARDTEQPAA
jgi:ParB family transcriptional regulator, chromosome partitioning protein